MFEEAYKDFRETMDFYNAKSLKVNELTALPPEKLTDEDRKYVSDFRKDMSVFFLIVKEIPNNGKEYFDWLKARAPEAHRDMLAFIETLKNNAL